jgi:signal transduction histidine kinase/AmiR/NasT family two-component response regulator
MDNNIKKNLRILIVDDNKDIHEDFKDILQDGNKNEKALSDEEAAIFGDNSPEVSELEVFELSSAFQGQEALEMVRQSLKDKRPYAMAFMDVRMPPGWDGIETIQRIWAEYPDLQVVICTAYSDYKWQDIENKLGRNEKLLILKKPFDNIEAYQFASALTEKWRLSQEVKIRQEELVELVEAKTEELKKANRELVETAKKAEQASMAKSEFLANMSHEIRTPMNSILGFSEVLAESEMTDEHKQYVNLIREGGTNLLGIINEILDFSKIEAGKLEINIAECSLEELLNNIEMLIGPSAAKKDLEFKVLQCGTLPGIIRTDQTRVRQCLINLVGNAIKFTDHGHVYLNVSVEKRTDGNFIRFDVEDTGTGMAPEELSVIFDSFKQVDGSATRAAGGTGLGLAITKRLANLLDGSVTVTSTKGEGSVFSLMVPCNVELSEQPAMDKYSFIDKMELGAAEINVEQIVFSGKALIVEDSKANQQLIEILLKKLGFETEIAENGKEAVELVAQNQFDLILMDMQMPVMNGYEATKAIREKGIKTPIIAITANAMKGDKEKCINAGCDHYTPKPVDRQELVKIIEIHMEPKERNISEQINSAKEQIDQLNSICTRQISSQPEPDEAVEIDFRTAIRSCGDESVLAQIGQTIVDDGPEGLSLLKSAIEKSKPKDILLYAHRLRGNALTIGAVEFARKAGQVEECGRKKDVKKAASLFDGLNKEFDKLIAFLVNPKWINSAKKQPQNLTIPQ